MNGILVVIILVVVLGAIALFVISQFNRLRRLDVQAQGAWAGVDTLLAKRADLVPNLVETVKGAADFERGTMEDVTTARARAAGATTVAETGRGGRHADAGAGPAVRRRRGLPPAHGHGGVP